MHTGNIDIKISLFLSFAVYPCAYREHPYLCKIASSCDGLSLCIQGTLSESLQSKNEARFIPVHTGNIWKKLVNEGGIAVYPCAYREHTNYNILSVSYTHLTLPTNREV